MNSTDIYQQKLVELIEQSARIDALVIKSRELVTTVKFDCTQELEELRAKQRETTHTLHSLEGSSFDAWENVGCGG